MERPIVLGSGPAGLTAALYLARANLKPIVIGGQEFGGQLMITTDVENYPGFPDGIQGPELMGRMRSQTERFGAEVLQANATKVEVGEGEAPIHKVWAGGQQYKTQALVIATGASALWLGLESETRLLGKGVTACATCDGFFFRGKEVAVVGGGDTALEEALFLTNFATKVYIVHRRDTFRASRIMQDRVIANSRIEIIYNNVVEEVVGDAKVQGVKLRDVVSGNTKVLDLEGVFIAIGHKPNTELFQDLGLGVDENGYLQVVREVFTSINGIFVAGDVADREYRQAITAAGSGCKAAIAVERYLSSIV